MLIRPNDPFIRYTGRWYITETDAYSTANGNYLEFCFEGNTAVIHYDIDNCVSPFPHVYVRVDNGAFIETVIDKYLRISVEQGAHKVQIILKSSYEYQNRWTEPIEAKVDIIGIEAESFLPLEKDDRPTIEFIGDSITEGTLVDPQYKYHNDRRDLVYMNDSIAGYAWQTAKMLNMRLITMGYGSLGSTKGGSGGVPPVEESYPFFCENLPMPSANADIIVINHGTNDHHSDNETFKKAYASFLRSVRERNKKSIIICIAPFIGWFTQEVGEVVASHNEKYKDSVHYVDTTGWISPDPMHPLRDACVNIAKRLAKIIDDVYR